MALFFVAATWGLTFPLIKLGIQEVSPEAFVAARFVISFVLLLPFVPRGGGIHREALRFGVVLGLLNIGLHLLQAHSLRTIGAARCAFLAGSNVLFVPFLEQWVGLRRITRLDVIATMVCLVGLYLLTGADLSDISFGDVMAVWAEVFFAVYVIVVALAGRRNVNYRAVTLYQLGTTSVVCLALAMPDLSLRAMVAYPMNLIIGVSAVGCTLLPLLMQAKFQPKLSAHTAALIITMEPAFAGVFSYFILGEEMTAGMFVGGGLMLLAAIIPQMSPQWFARRSAPAT